MARLILASQSRARQDMLRAAGLEFEIRPAQVDEPALMRKLVSEWATAPAVAESLAEEKALAVSREIPGAFVIGADQVLECGGQLMSKAKDEPEAREKLKALRGRTHRLISAVALARGGRTLWRAAREARLRMRDFDEAFLDAYCGAAGEALTRSVGAYELEGPGINLFEEIEGDYFTVLGLPLLPLLNGLRRECGIGLGERAGAE